MTGSDALYVRALRVTPGGVHSPVRAFRRVGGTPRFMRAGRGSIIEDVDGRSYIDFCMAFGPLILGHAHPAVLAAVAAAAGRGWSLGTADPYSLELAEFIADRVPWVESLRFVSSGTEAVMSVLRIARAWTGRQQVLKFEGCYHGHVDSLLVRAGSGLAGHGQADSAGVPTTVTAHTLVAPMDDEPALERIFSAHGHQLAAAIIEPLPANHGLLPQRPEFLATLARLCRQNGALLIFDEVITGFRVGFGGMAAATGIRPDLVTYGKIIGGGFPVGAYGGHRDLLSCVAPDGPVYQAGTLAGNPVSMAAGLATLRQLSDGSAYRSLEETGRLLEQALACVPELILQRAGSIFWLVPSAGAPVGAPSGASGRMAGDPASEYATGIRAPDHIPARVEQTFPPLFHALLDRGIYLPPSPYEVCFLSTAHSTEDIQALAAAVQCAL